MNTFKTETTDIYFDVSAPENDNTYIKKQKQMAAR